jgi:plastocyanin
MKEKISMIPLRNRRSGFRPKAALFNCRGLTALYRDAATIHRGLFGSLKMLPGFLALALGLLVPFCSMADNAGTNSVQVTVDNFSFTPPALAVHAGTKVTWVNKDDVPHTVTSDDQLFGSRALDTDDKFSFTFQTPGTYSYYCSVHPKMTGKVVVK